MDEKLARLGFIFSLTGGIIGVLSGLALLLLSVFGAVYRGIGGAAVGTFTGIIALYVLITAGLVILGAVWMRTEKRCLTGAIISIIFSVIGAGTIFGIIGGILGIIAAKR